MPRSNKLTRRDQCFLVGKRAGLLDPSESARAWSELAALLYDMGQIDVPKFRHLLNAIRLATIRSRR